VCGICGKKWEPLKDRYPCGPCPDEWVCPFCKEEVSPCCGTKLTYEECRSECEICDYCGSATCSECGRHTHCGGCV
jgi:hypothetical protein